MQICSRCRKNKEDSEFKPNRKMCIACSGQKKEYCETHKEQTRENSLFHHAKKRAKDKNLEFNITREDIKELLQTTTCCPIMNIPFEMGNGCVCGKSVSLDRINPKLGYIKGNIQLLSHKANTIKNNLTLQEHEEFLKNWEEYETSKIKFD